MFCARCASQRPDSDRFCAACGGELHPSSMSTPSPVVAAEAAALVGAEHTGLREEIIKRIELQVQLVSITLAAAGVFLAVGLPKDLPAGASPSAAPLLVYPLLALFTWATWVFHQLRITEVAMYLKSLERKFPDILGWELFSERIRGRHFFSRNLPFLTFGGLWVSSQAIVLFVGMILDRHGRPVPLEEQVLAGLDVLAIALTILLILVFSVPGFRRLLISES